MLTPATTELCRIHAAEMFTVCVLYFNTPDTMYNIDLGYTEIRIRLLGRHGDIVTATAVYTKSYTEVGIVHPTQRIRETTLACEIYDRSIKQICRTRRSS